MVKQNQIERNIFLLNKKRGGLNMIDVDCTSQNKVTYDAEIYIHKKNAWNVIGNVWL